LTGAGRNQPTIATPRVTNNASVVNATVVHPGVGLGGLTGGQGGGPEGMGGKFDTVLSYRPGAIAVLNLRVGSGD
jgi:hypothetical protein